eukprot:jgi/Mesen1/9465/ME000627S08839
MAHNGDGAVGEYNPRDVHDCPHGPEPTAPLIPQTSKQPKLSSTMKTFGNIIVSIVGSGVLGLPYTFMRSGWLFSLVALTVVAMISYYGMILLVKCRKRVVQEVGGPSIKTYGDLGQHVYGSLGRLAVDVMILCSQGGFCVAYLIFIGTNVSSVIGGGLKQKALCIMIVAPMQMLLSWMNSLTRLAPLSIFADVVNLVAYAIIIGDDFSTFKGYADAHLFTGVSNMTLILGVAVYAYEGVGVTLSLERNMKDPAKFAPILGLALSTITVVYGLFGTFGYFGFGTATEEIITLNLPVHWTTDFVKLGISTALFFTFPVMMHPVYEVYERRIAATEWFETKVAPHRRYCRGLINLLRSLVVLLVVYIAIAVPSFAVFISLVGSSFCSLLGFVFPALFHLHILGGNNLSWPELAADYFLMIFGVCFGVWGTYTCLHDIFFTR